MKRSFEKVLLSACLLAVMALTACECADREERIAEARARQGLAEALVVAEPLSPSAQLYRDLTCNTCHGDDGITPLLPSYPVIARQGEEYALKQMMDIRSGDRAGGQAAAMKPIIAEVSDEDLATLAAYIANELGGDKPIGTGIVDEDSPGAKLFKAKTCTACHGKDAVSPILASYPKIAGHPAEYALQQMKDIKNGVRANGMAVAGMKGIMHLVNEEEMGHLANYIASLPR